MSTIELTRVVAAPPARAFAAWTDPELLATWWWPMLPDATYALDARPGGTLRIHSAQAGFGVTGEFVDVVPERLLRFTWTWVEDDAGAPSEPPDLVEVAFAALDAERTEVTVRHTSGEELAGSGIEQGWRACLDRLAAPSPP